MIDDVLVREVLRTMGIHCPPEDVVLGDGGLGMDQLEVKRFRQLVEIRLGRVLPDGFHISRKDTLSEVAGRVDQCLRGEPTRAA